MDFIYFFSNASLVLRLIDWLSHRIDWGNSHITVVHRLEGWIVKLHISEPLSQPEAGDAQAFMNELGSSFQPPLLIQTVFHCLEQGQSPVNVMRQCQVVVVSHGAPNREDIATFRERFIHGLGYCPAHLA